MWRFWIYDVPRGYLYISNAKLSPSRYVLNGVTNMFVSLKISLVWLGPYHYNDVIMDTIASQITSLTNVYSTFIQTQIKENIKAPRHWPLCGEFPAQMASNTENASIWWRHHALIASVASFWTPYLTSRPVTYCFGSHSYNFRLRRIIARYFLWNHGIGCKQVTDNSFVWMKKISWSIIFEMDGREFDHVLHIKEQWRGI